MIVSGSRPPPISPRLLHRPGFVVYGGTLRGLRFLEASRDPHVRNRKPVRAAARRSAIVPALEGAAAAEARRPARPHRRSSLQSPAALALKYLGWGSLAVISVVSRVERSSSTSILSGLRACNRPNWRTQLLRVLLRMARSRKRLREVALTEPCQPLLDRVLVDELAGAWSLHLGFVRYLDTSHVAAAQSSSVSAPPALGLALPASGLLLRLRFWMERPEPRTPLLSTTRRRQWFRGGLPTRRQSLCANALRQCSENCAAPTRWTANMSGVGSERDSSTRMPAKR